MSLLMIFSARAVTAASLLVVRLLVVAAVGGAGEVHAQPPGWRPPGPSTVALWHLPGEATGTPAHDDDTVYFLSHDREVVALDLASGAVRWRTGTGITNRDHLFGTSTAGTAVRLAGDLVIAGDWDVVAFDRRSGARRWVYEAPDGDGPGLFLGVVSGDHIFAGSADGQLYAIDAGSGRLRWTMAAVEARGIATTVFPPVVERDVVYAAYSSYGFPAVGGVVAVDAGTGRLRWRTPFPPPRVAWAPTNRSGGPIVVGDLVFASSGDGNIHAFDGATGAAQWAFPRLEGPFLGVSQDTDIDTRALTAQGRLLIAGSALGVIVAYDIDTRQVRWRHDAGQWGSTGFTIASDAGLVYVPFFGGFLMAFDVASGEERWRFGDFTKGFLWAPDPAGTRVFASAGRTGFYALSTTRPENGR